MFKEFNGLKIGDKVVIKGWTQFQPKVAEITQHKGDGEKTKWEFDTGYVRVKLDWSEYGFAPSYVSFHDENKQWFRFSSAN